MAVLSQGWPRRALATLRVVKNRLDRHRAGLLAAGVAFYALLSLFPAIAVLVALGGLAISPADIVEAAEALGNMLPEAAGQIVFSQLEQIASAESGDLQIAALIGFAVALYSASKAVGSLIEGVRAAHEESSNKGWFAALFRTLGLTLVLLVVALLMLVSVLVIPALIGTVFQSSTAAPWIALLRWPIVAGVVLLGVAVVYRGARKTEADRAGRKFITSGAIFATLAILPASVGFSIYVENFANYNESFGTLGGVITLLVWLWLSAFIIIAGAEIDAEDEADSSR